MKRCNPNSMNVKSAASCTTCLGPCSPYRIGPIVVLDCSLFFCSIVQCTCLLIYFLITVKAVNFILTVQILYIAMWGMHGVCLRCYKNKWEEYLVCHALPCDSCKLWSCLTVWSESHPSERPSSTPDKQLPSSPRSLSHSSWAAKTGNKVENTKEKMECCSTQFCVQDVTVIILGCAGVCFILMQLSPAW